MNRAGTNINLPSSVEHRSFDPRAFRIGVVYIGQAQIKREIRVPPGIVDDIVPGATKASCALAPSLICTEHRLALETGPSTQCVIEDDFATGRLRLRTAYDAATAQAMPRFARG